MIQYRTEVDFHTQGKVYGRKEMPELDVLNWSTVKRYGTPAGTWQMTLSTRPDKDGKTWFDKLSPQDFVRIRLAIGDGPFITVMNGLINRVARSTTVNPGSGAVQETISITGLDLAKVLTKFHLWYNPHGDGLEGLIRGLALLTNEAFKNLSVERALKALLDLAFNKKDSKFVIDVEKAQGGPLSVFVDLGNDGLKPIWELLQLHATVGAVSSDTYALTTFEGALWNGLRRWANEPWNELFADNGHPDNAADAAGDGGTQSLREDPDTTYIYLRPAPFLKERFERLVTHDLSYEDIQTPFSVSKGDDDTYTCYFAYPVLITMLTETQALAMSEGTRIIQKTGKEKQTTRPISEEPTTSFANRFGFRKLDAKSIYLAVGYRDEDTGEIREGNELREDLFKELTDELVEFFDPNPTFLQGRVTVKPNRSKTLIKMGQRVRIRENAKGRPDEIYYVVGVQNQWQFSGTFTQTLDLHRGVTAPK